MQLFDYDDGSEESIYNYAKKLENLTFADIINIYNLSNCKYYKNPRDLSYEINDDSVDYSALNDAKGQLGVILEKYYFGYRPNNNQEPDFPKVGIELKQTCIDKKKNGDYTAGERLSITNISYREPVETNFYKSHVWEKMRKILLVHYLRDRSLKRLDYKIMFVNLFTPPKADLDIIIQDYVKINKKIKAGLAHELSESDTLYLGACTKGATASKSIQPQYYGEHIPAKKRNYCFKRQYMDYILNTYVLKNTVPYESIIKTDQVLDNQTFEDYILNKIKIHIGKSDKQLCHEFSRDYNNNKAQWKDLAFRMLGVKSNNAAEFQKANIEVKTIRLEENGKNKESISFPPFKFAELINEEWENSTVFNYFETTQFLLVVFKKKKNEYILQDAKLWHMPFYDLNVLVKDEWLSYVNKIKKGIHFQIKNLSNGKISISNDLPKMKDTRVIHIRPHAKKAAYKLKNGYMQGDIFSDGDQLPNGEWMTRQSFWINSTYILSQLQSNR